MDVATVRCATMLNALILQRQTSQTLRVCIGGEHSQRRVHEKRFGGQAGVATNSHGCCSAAARRGVGGWLAECEGWVDGMGLTRAPSSVMI